MISFDTNILIYATKLPTAPDPRGFNQSARELLSELSNNNAHKEKRVILPSVCLAEYLTGVEKPHRNAVLKNLESWAFIAGFDAKAASIAADLLHDAFSDWKQLKANEPDHEYAKRLRQLLKSDVLVLATAIAHGGTVLYTTDENTFSRLAGGKIIVKNLPVLQPTLFDTHAFHN